MKLISKIISYSVRLTLLCSFAAGSLALVYMKTLPMIEYQKKKEEIEFGRKKVLPQASIFKEEENYVAGYNEKNEIVGKIITSNIRGYGGNIRLMVGMDNENKIIGVKILEQYETPGVGDQILDKKFLSQFENKDETDINFRKDGGKIDAITGATISSKALLKGVQEVFKYVKE
ncbi:MAG: hypothetical protein AUJ85_05835 [Elusimicrobia bacterium CG1_02_37_114]|nr:MAG: hypothetical protein AUJ85_05835 [Elusimicrobia bacterium CG1_02_37_114]PIV52936.1 MAG: hypothetical protein COS17_06565 [Elusimicrobia bacterium CG02_land_8_20_14_3_00_37_13]PIZ14016.1 MAG: hypothetical protein COY53_01815 [Elusimicrobia bacterium CG_4_10_14_0_8_um_filter_37_32]